MFSNDPPQVFNSELSFSRSSYHPRLYGQYFYMSLFTNFNCNLNLTLQFLYIDCYPLLHSYICLYTYVCLFMCMYVHIHKMIWEDSFPENKKNTFLCYILNTWKLNTVPNSRGFVYHIFVLEKKETWNLFNSVLLFSYICKDNEHISML